jgi:HTH-type transcriptional regulator/antitoxin HigA
VGLFDTIREVAEAFPPGDFIKEELEARGWSQSDLAEIIGRNTGTVSQIISGKQPINPRIATALGAAFGTDAQSWMNLQSAYQLWRERQEEDSEAVRRRAMLYTKAPLKEMLKRHWIEASESIDVIEQRVCQFLEIDSLSSQPQCSFAARQTASYSVPPSTSVVAWIKRAKHLAEIIPASKYTDAGLEKALPALRKLMASEDGAKQVPRLLASVGIRIVAVERLPTMKLDGVTFWLDKNSPVIALSLRNDRLDWFWHTLLHEIDHIRHGEGKEEPCLDDLEIPGIEKPANERRCDEFAASFSIDRKSLDQFIVRVRPYFTSDKATGFALRMNVHPSIAAGQIRNRLENYSVLSSLVGAKIRSHLFDTILCDGWGHEPGFAERG